MVGLNPSRGRVSGGPHNQDSGFGFARQFVVCKTVPDMASALDVFSGPHPGDPFIIAQPTTLFGRIEAFDGQAAGRRRKIKMGRRRYRA
ncbi:hypothetical protein [Sinorhizobium meliloti]|uniref:hypothetical protein n=1 Tax=Rhizobium meliloti TaxID=382 RepID=UPI002356F2FB|nr:hypothetical protein [Sinorhizobium meliloti]